MDLSKLIISILAFLVVILGFTNLNADLSAKLGMGSIKDISGNFSYLAQLEADAQDVANTITNSQITGTPFDLPLVVVSGVYNVLKLVFHTLTGAYTQLIWSIAFYLHLPTWLIGILLTAAAIYISFKVISPLIRWPM